MKAFTSCLFLGLTVTMGLAQAEIIKQRAKDLSRQNNERQGVAPPAPVPAPRRTAPPPAAPPAAAPTLQLTPEQQGLARLQADLAAFKVKVAATPEQKQRFAADLMAAARGAPKPSAASVNRLADNLAAALTNKTLSPAQQSRLAQNLNAVMNAAGYPETQIRAVLEDAQTLLQPTGPPDGPAPAAVADLKTIAAEVRKPGPQ
jgi:hypothetical protein